MYFITDKRISTVHNYCSLLLQTCPGIRLDYLHFIAEVGQLD